jgi:16S rRNA (cytidine1402-2'-O)-methyltransferase
MRPRILSALDEGKAVLLVSDAGTPLISDPGYRIVREARDAGHKIWTIPGPSALIAALSIAGAPTDRFSFLGFLPKGQGQREKLLKASGAREETLIAYETGPRIAATLKTVDEVLGPVTAAVARELTKLHEEVVEGDAGELAARYEENPPKGEIVLIIHPAKPAVAPDLDSLLEQLLATERVKDAASIAAEMTGLPRKECYARALALKSS